MKLLKKIYRKIKNSTTKANKNEFLVCNQCDDIDRKSQLPQK